jgi:uncharacterized protein YggE
MESKPDTIKISASHREAISADRADLFVSVKGSSLVSGDQAMKKAKEVSQLVEALTSPALSGDEGSRLSPEAIHLQGVHIEASSGTLLKSSSATYRLRVGCGKLDQLAELLDIIAAQKNASLERIEWKYSEDAEREQAMELVLGKAKAKAEKIAKSLGVKLLGVYEFIENVYDEERPYPQFAAQAMPARAMAKGAPEPSLGMDIQHSKTINISVDIWYRVSEF